jgi:hypothetical protein
MLSEDLVQNNAKLKPQFRISEVYVCACVRICMRIRVRVYICMHVYTYVYIWHEQTSHIHTYIQARYKRLREEASRYGRPHTYVHTYIHTYIQARCKRLSEEASQYGRPTYIHTHIHICKIQAVASQYGRPHTYIHSYIHTYIHTGKVQAPERGSVTVWQTSDSSRSQYRFG